MINLRPYQHRALKAGSEAFAAGHGAILLVAPTGSGKTVIGSFIARSHLGRSAEHYVLVIVPRIELASQWAATFERVGLRVNVDLDGASQLQLDGEAPRVLVVTVQALLARKAVPHATLVIADEAHHYVSGEWIKMVAPHRARGARVVGLTATPERGDGTGLGELFDHLIPVASIAELTRLGFLVPCRVIAPKVPRDLKAEPGAVVLAEDPVKSYLAAGRDSAGTLRRAIVYCRTIAQAEDVAKRMGEAGVASSVIHSKLKPDERRERIAGFRSKAITCLVNVDILTEGFDDPSVEVVVLARKIGHVGLYLQIVGRALRPSLDTGKTDALLLDLGGSHARHGDPDEERDYSLDGEPIRLRSAKPRKCPRCGVKLRARDLREERCRTCGARLGGGIAVRVQPQPLQLVAPDAAGRDRRARIVAELADEVVRKGWKPGALYHRARNRGIDLSWREAQRALEEAARWSAA